MKKEDACEIAYENGFTKGFELGRRSMFSQIFNYFTDDTIKLVPDDVIFSCENTDTIYVEYKVGLDIHRYVFFEGRPVGWYKP